MTPAKAQNYRLDHRAEIESTSRLTHESTGVLKGKQRHIANVRSERGRM